MRGKRSLWVGLYCCGGEEVRTISGTDSSKVARQNPLHETEL